MPPRGVVRTSGYTPLPPPGPKGGKGAVISAGTHVTRRFTVTTTGSVAPVSMVSTLCHALPVLTPVVAAAAASLTTPHNYIVLTPL